MVALYAMILYGVFGLDKSGLYLAKLMIGEKLPSLWDMALYIHIFGSAASLLLGPFLFLKNIRKRNPSLHRMMGVIYVLSIVIGGLSGFYLGFYSTGGMVSHIGFILLAVLWIFTSIMGAFYGIKNKLSFHRAWMIRSYSLTLAAVTLRLWLGLAALLFGGEAYVIYYTVIAWLCWVPNILIAWILTKPYIRKGKAAGDLTSPLP